MRLSEYGFWDYTTPMAGGMERYERDDYLMLLDDMAGAAMNSLMICVKWGTTGYRSRLPFLDQWDDNPVTASDNDLLRDVIAEANARGIKVWLGAVVSIYVLEQYGGEPRQVHTEFNGATGVPIGIYDSDSPGFTENAIAVCEEIVEEFPGIGGLEVEMEGSGVETPHRIPLFNEWAKANGRRTFDQLGHPLDPRVFDVGGWRDYATQRRIDVLRAVENAVRAKGFAGDFSTIFETACTDYSIGQEVNLDMVREQLPNWRGIGYEYDKAIHRGGMMDMAIGTPMAHGHTVYYLPRGVMTWGRWPLPIPIEENWRRDVEDIERYRPYGVWWFGSGGIGVGGHVSVPRLQEIGYADGPAARRALIETARSLRA